ncbi:DASS family sodium-coupled anion symporter [Geobacter sp. DSM 9736]|uniref:SLC13 family permease n=1 Tax=Geobacter sp. DSM 9736 TaxID=1277350 RepID=UPI000B50A037|nr:DASS family sodium-coupled anion symporter [Geobacter sp. DSM 9736]SNB45121.1 solute carrier family 13 (sodium-dependent dicarboxylate transporter), member 2/3/5 [Geobacter sp. DSM 9736]
MEQITFDKPLKVDRRPIWLILFDRTFHYQIFGGLILLCAFLFNLTPPQGLTVQGYHAMILFGATVFLWVSGLLPLAVTSLVAMAMIPLLGIMEAKKTYAMFGNEAVFFILGAFILAAAMTGSGLSTRLARGMLATFGKTPTRLALTVYLLCAFLSFCMSEHAVAAMMFPIVAEISQSLRLDGERGSYGKLLFMSIAWGCVIGGIATFLGGARAPLAVGMLRETTGLDFSFFEWTMAAIMIVIPLLAIGFMLLLKLFPQDIASVDEGLRFLNRKRLEAGRMSYDEMIVAVVMVATILAWIFFGKALGLAAIATLAVAVLFTCRVVSWQAIEEYVNWGVILMYGGAIAIASALEKTGAAQWLAGKGLAGLGHSPFMVITIISLISLLLTECISNAAVIAILLPIGISLAKSMGMDPRVMTLAVTLPAGLAYCLPMGTPANAIVYSSGFLKGREMIVSGLVIMTISWLLFLASARFVWPLLGFKI